MPETITAKYIDSELQNIRQLLAGKKGQIPILLLPVRIEARFMKVEKSIGTAQEGKVERLLGELAGLEVDLEKGLPNLSANKLKLHYNDIIRRISKARTAASQLAPISLQQKNWLKELAGEISTAVKQTITQFPPFLLSSVRPQLLSQTTRLVNTINALKTIPDPAFRAANDYLGQLKSIVGTLVQINEGKIPFTRPKNKKQLYNYIENLQAEVVRFYRPTDEKIGAIRRIKNNQLKRIEELHEQGKELLKQLPQAIAGLHRDTAWENFIQRIEQEVKAQLVEGVLHFEHLILPKLHYVSDIRHVSATELYYKSIRAFIEVERFNAIADLKGVSKVRKSRQRLQKKMTALQNMSQRVVEGDPAQIEAISQLWKQMNDSVKQYSTKLNSTKPNKSGPQFGWNTSLQFLHTKVQPVLRQFTQTQLGAHAQFSGRDYREGQSFYFNANRELTQLSQKETGFTKVREQEFRNELHQLANQFRITGRKKLPLTQNQFQEVELQIKRLQKKIKKVRLHKDADIQKNLGAIEVGLSAGSVIIDQAGAGILDQPVVLAVPKQEVNELWVRIFPDDIHVHTHEEALTQEEFEDGKRFWDAWWAATDDHDLELGAWRALLSSHGSQRAAWIARALDPRKLRSNAQTLKKKPGKAIQQVTQAFKNAANELDAISGDMDGEAMLNAINGTQLANRINQINNLLSRIPFEQVAFLQRAFQELRKLESKLLILQTQLNLTAPEILATHQAEMVQIQAAFNLYPQVQERFQNIEPLDTARYLDRRKSKLRFPRVGKKEKEWSQAPHSRTLPDRFVVLTMNGNEYTHIAVGRPVPPRLHVGLDPATFDFEEEIDNPYKLQADGSLQVDEGMRWMLDFEEAIEKGMGLKIPLTQEEAEQGFDRVLAIGIRDTDERQGQQLLEDLIENHHYAPEGMSVLPIGTATNNTSEEASGFNSLEDDPEESYRVEMGGDLFSSSEKNQLAKADGKRLADALGVNPAVLQHLANSDGQEISQAFAIHRSLWHATFGDYLESSFDYIFTYDNIERAYQFFSENVVARGVLPSIRVGSQPYGILPTTAFSKFKLSNNFDENNLPSLSQQQVVNPTTAGNNRLQLRFDLRLKKLLGQLNAFWTILQKSKVKHAYNQPTEADEGDLETLPSPQQHFIEMLGLQASSIEYFFRYGINIAYRGPDPEELGFNVNFTEESLFGPTILQSLFGHHLKEGYFFKSFEFEDERAPNSDPDVQATIVANRVKLQFSKSRIFKSRFLDKHSLVSGPIIDTQELSAENTVEKTIGSGVKTSYIHWLLEGADSLYDILERNNFDILPSNSMLFLLLRQSLLLAYREAALHIMQEEGFFSEDYRRLIGAGDRFRLYNAAINKYVYTSKWTFLFRDPKTFNGLEGIDFALKADGTPNRLFQHLNNGDRSLADFLLNKNNLFNSYSNQPALQQYRDRVDEVRAAMAVLDTIPTKKLDQLLAEHMDVSSYRLDAWMLGYANRRLAKQRNEGRRKGIYLGAYGWLEDLTPGGKRDEAVHLSDELIPADRSAVFTDEDNDGFIHAPSINQAIAAAVLRSGYTASQESIGDLKNQMAVNLSSRRVRMALQLVDGVNNGQSLGAILGFQFERGLHESYSIAELDRFIYGFRRKFPLVVPLEITTSEAEENPQINVVDGFALLEKVEEHIKNQLTDVDTDQSIFEILNSVPFNRWPSFITSIVDDGLQPGDNRATILRAIAREIDRIGDALDALGDLVISESVYQVVQGNHVRAAAVVEALAAGKAPPEFQFIHTPRTGVVITHRAVLHFERIAANAATAPGGWPAVLTPRAKAEPSLNQWLAGILGPAQQIRCLVTHEMEGLFSPLEVSVHDLGLHAIDLIYMLGFNAEQGGSELESRIAWHLQQLHTFSPDANLKVSFTERSATWTSDQKTIYEITPLVLQLRDMLSDAKYVDALDIMMPEDDPDLDNPERLHPEDLETRINAAEASYRSITTNAQTFIDNNFAVVVLEEATFTSGQLDRLRSFLFDLAAFGSPGSIPTPSLETNDQAGRAMLERLLGALSSASKLLKALDRLKAKLGQAGNVRQKVDTLISMGRQLFGRTMILLPHYQPKNSAAIKDQLDLPADRGLLHQHTDPHILNDWMQDLADLRPGLYALDMSCMLTQNFGQDFPEWYPVQFPYQDGDAWLGLEYEPPFQPEGDFLSLLLFDHTQLTGSGTRKVGIIVDEWTEIIPNREEVSGLAFHYDQPDAQAPQNLLLAVNPDLGNSWTWDNLVYTLNETLDLAKNRAVEPDHIEESIFAQVLPNIISEVAPPQLRQYDEDEDANEKPYQNPLGTQVVMDFADNLPKDEEDD